MVRDIIALDAPQRRGRPTREEALRRDGRLLEVATRLFMERGFDGTSMDAVAEAAGIGKPTLYGRYRDKRELFEAVLKSRIQDWLLPISSAAEEQQGKAESGSLETVLDGISRAVLSHATQPDAAALHRVLAAQALRFPELAELAQEQGWRRAVDAVATVLRAFERRGLVTIPEPDLAAELFLNLLLGPASRAALYGMEIDEEALERRRRAALALFLRGIGHG